MDIGILGGTFDPIHNGHLIIAEEVRTRLALAEIVFIPAGQPWLKTGSSISAVEHRLHMVRLAIADKPYFKLSTIEVERAGPSYTVETLIKLKEQYSPEDRLVFIIGWDSLAQLSHWKDPSRLVEMCRLVVVPRPGISPPDINRLEKNIPGLSRIIIQLDGPLVDISASQIRDRVSRGQEIDRLVPEPVMEYIREHRLY